MLCYSPILFIFICISTTYFDVFNSSILDKYLVRKDTCLLIKFFTMKYFIELVVLNIVVLFKY